MGSVVWSTVGTSTSADGLSTRPIIRPCRKVIIEGAQGGVGWDGVSTSRAVRGRMARAGLRLPVLAAAAPGETYGFSIQYEALVVRVDVRSNTGRGWR